METSLIFDLINRFFLFIVLTVAGVAKAFDIKSISKPLQELGIPNKNIATTAGFVIMGIEISTGIMLLIPKVILVGGIVAIMLFGAFVILGLLVPRMGKQINCGCFGAMSNEQIGDQTVVRGFLFLTASLCALAFHINPTHIGNSGWFIGELTRIIPIMGMLLTLIGAGLTLSKLNFSGYLTSSPSGTAKLSRRDFLKLAFSFALSLGASLLKPSLTHALTCKCQKLDHYDPTCCSGQLDPYHIRHYYKRCCRSDGVVGYWHQYQPNGCQCNCITFCADVYYPCQGNPCWQGECGCAQ
jgi:hypothetical protein